LKRDGTCAETIFGLSAKRMSPFKLVGASVQSTTGSRCVCISGSNGSNSEYTMFHDRVQDYWLPTPLTFPLHFPYCASPCAIRFQLSSTYCTYLCSRSEVEAVGSSEILMSYPRTHYCSNFHQAKILKIVFLKVTNKRVMI